MSHAITAHPTLQRTDASRRMWAICGAVYLIGIAWRCYYIFWAHPAANYIYSDMSMYVNYGLHLADPDYVGVRGDTYFPPGMGLFLAWAYKLDSTWWVAYLVQFVLASLNPLLLYGIARELYDRRVALLSLALASLYFPFIEFSAFFMAENPLIFCMLLSLWLLLLSLRAPRTPGAAVLSVAAGATLALGVQFKPLAILPGTFIAIFLAYVAVRHRWRRMFVTVGCVTAGVALVMVPFAVRATRLNEGHLCLVATNGPVCFLVAHDPSAGSVTFDDTQRHYFMTFLAPPAGERHVTRAETFYFGAYESEKVMALAWDRINANKLEAFAMSFDHVFETFFGIVPFPSSGTDMRRWMDLFQKAFVVLLFIPAAFYLSERWRLIWRRQPQAYADILMAMPIAGLAVMMLLFTVGETRYRVPFDGFFIILAARFYMGMGAPVDNVFTRSLGPPNASSSPEAPA